MTFFARLFSLLLLSFLFALPAAAQPPTPLIPQQTLLVYDQRTEPTALLASYYNAISRGDYARAYHYWEQAPAEQTELQFANGFADTFGARVLVELPIFADAGAGNLYASVPTLVIALRTDLTQQFYQGCFVLHKTNVPVGNAAEPDPNWYLQRATLRQVAAPDFTSLAASCEAHTNLTENPFEPQTLDPLGVIETYFTSIAKFDISSAETNWENAADDVVISTYSRELRAMLSFNLFVNPEIYGQGAAGSSYAKVPAMLMLNAPDGTHSYLTGCYTTRASNVPVGDATTPDPNWHITVATVNLEFDPLVAVGTLAAGCEG
ncbi:MAG: hypothetical protein R3E39_24055 [Anaerolineae bacterium]